MKPQLRGAAVVATGTAGMALLTGCVKVGLDLTITPETVTIDGTLVMTMPIDPELFDCAAVQEEVGTAEGVVFESYEEDGKPGCRFQGSTPVSELPSDGPQISVADDQITFTYPGVGGGDQISADLAALTPQISMSVTMPGEIIDAGGGTVRRHHRHLRPAGAI